MLSKLCMQLLVGAAVIGSSVYSADGGGHGAVAAAHVPVGSDRVTFQGVVPSVGVGNQWVLDMLILQVQNPQWNGVLELQLGQDLNTLDAAQLRTFGERIQELPILAGRQVVFAAAVPVDAMRQEVRIAQFDATLEVPFLPFGFRNEELANIFRLPFGEFINGGEKRSLDLSRSGLPGVTLGKAWKFLGEFIAHYNCGMQESALLMEDVRGLQQRLKIDAGRGIALVARASQLWDVMNVEFEKALDQRNREKVQSTAAELGDLLREIYGFFGFGEGMGSPIQALQHFLADQPGDKKFEAFMQCRGGFAVDTTHQAAAPEKTTSEMLDDLLTTKPNKDIAASVEGAAPGLVKTIRLGGERLWNVYKLDDPQAAKWQENAQNRGWNGQYGGMWNPHQDWQFNNEVVQPSEAQFKTVAEKLNLKDGSYTMSVRVPAGGSHQFRILGFIVRHDAWNPAANRMDVRVALERYIGLVEIVEAKDGDATVPMYDPLRVHSADSIGGTMMAQRVHEAMAEYRVQQFGKLPENVRVHLREQVEAYTDQLNINRLENQRLHQYAPTRDEVKLPVGADADRIHALAQSKAAKLSAELKDRLAAERALRMRTHGDDLRNNPSQHMQSRVHGLFDRVHDKRDIMKTLTPREKEFLRDNKPGGYVDTVERTVAAQQVPFDPARGPASVHYSERLHGGRIHAERLHGGKHAVAVSAPGAQYGNISDALDDYDLGGNDDGEPGRGAFLANAAEKEGKYDE